MLEGFVMSDLSYFIKITTVITELHTTMQFTNIFVSFSFIDY